MTKKILNSAKKGVEKLVKLYESKNIDNWNTELFENISPAQRRGIAVRYDVKEIHYEGCDNTVIETINEHIEAGINVAYHMAAVNLVYQELLKRGDG